jgi:hypothetical protein
LRGKPINLAQAALDLGIELIFVVVVISQCGVYLSEGQVSMLKVDFLRAPTMGYHVQGNLDDLRVRVVNPGDPALVQPNMCGRQCWHNTNRITAFLKTTLPSWGIPPTHSSGRPCPFAKVAACTSGLSTCPGLKPSRKTVRAVQTRRPPRCECGGFLKPATISFGQSLVPEDMDRAGEAAAVADLVIALGSSLSVYPAASIPLVAARRGVPYVVINGGPTEHDHFPGLALRLEGDVTELFPPMVRAAFAAS